jgi:hypothetical protein
VQETPCNRCLMGGVDSPVAVVAFQDLLADSTVTIRSVRRDIRDGVRCDPSVTPTSSAAKKSPAKRLA